MIVVVFIYLYIVLCALLACLGDGRLGGYWLALAFCLLFTPIFGWIITLLLCSKDKPLLYVDDDDIVV
ncbi:MAG: hypothetical protein LBK47_07420 [Prevotellaceae bacterium]|jgi:hypothetical protein|nr:hypothetical protein [Prevotellaceae bacterium]